MEPLSVIGSIISIIQVAGKVISVCYDYRSKIRNATRDLIRITDEVTSLRDVLERLVRLAESADVSGPSGLSVLELLNKPDGPLIKCQIELVALEKRLTLISGLKILSWPLKEAEVKDTLDNIARFKATLILALNADQTTLALAIQDNVTSLTRSLSLTRLDQHQRNIYQWLSAPDPSTNHEAACKKRQPTTGLWLVEGRELAHWKAASDSMLWLYGIHSTLRVAYFYFDFSDGEKQHHENLIRSLITQLSTQSMGIPEALQALYSRSESGRQQPSKDGLVVTLQSILKDFCETYIILDALDECADREELLELIRDINGWKIGRIHILVTSRKERNIEVALEPLVTDQICIQSAQVHADIQLHIRERLHNDQNLKKWPVKVKEEIEETLIEGAHGMFRWAVCQLDALRKCLKVDTLRKALKSLPKTLDDTYARILLSIDEEYAQDAFEILQWLAFSARPMRIEEVAEVIAVDLECDPRFDYERRLPEPRDILVICSSLVTISPGVLEYSNGRLEETVELRLAHFSVKEYLISERIRPGPVSKFSILEMPAHLFISQACLAYVLQFNKPDSLTEDTCQKYPLTRYAAQYWAQHARAGGASRASLNPLTAELFGSERDCFLNWIRIFDPDFPSAEPSFSREMETIAPQLYYAILLDLEQVVPWLLERGADVNAQGGRFGNALQTASLRGHDQVVQQLLERGANVGAQGGFCDNALQAASCGGHAQIVRRLLERGADVNRRGGNYTTALQAASHWGHDQVIQQLLDAGADINAQGGEDNTALQLASARGQSQVVQRLLERGADPNVQGGYFGNALQAASLNGDGQVVQQLLEKDVNVNAQGGYFGNALQAASHWGHDKVVQRLLETGANANAQGGYFGNALQAASYWGHDQVVQRLLENGANVNAQGGYYGNALQAASHQGNDQVIQRLLEKGADVNAQGGHFGNALQAASRWGRDQVVQRLLERGADVSAQGGYHGSAIQAASYWGHDRVIQRLLESGAGANAQKERHGDAPQTKEPAQQRVDVAPSRTGSTVGSKLIRYASVNYASLSDLEGLSEDQLRSLDESLRRLILYVRYADWEAFCRTDKLDRDFREALRAIGVRWSEGLAQPHWTNGAVVPRPRDVRMTAGEIRHYIDHGGSWYVPQVYPERVNVMNALISLCLWRGVPLE